jgi:hypothetical protein
MSSRVFLNFSLLSAMFCSEGCKVIALQKFHQFECQGAAAAGKEEATIEMQMLCEMLSQFDWNVDAMRKFFKDNKTRETVFDYDMSEPEDRDKKLLLATVKSRTKKKFAEDYLNEFLAAQANFIETHEKLRSVFASQQDKEFLNSLLQQCFQSSFEALKITCFETNIDMTVREVHKVEMFPMEEFEKGNFFNPVGIYANPYRPLTAHSCAYSVTATINNGKTVWIVTRPLSAGDQLTLNNYLTTDEYQKSKTERQYILMKECGLQCECDRCVNDWKYLKEEKGLFHYLDFEQVSHIFEKLFRCTFPIDSSKINRLTIAKETFALVPILSQYLPNREFWIYQLSLKVHVSHLALPRIFEKQPIQLKFRNQR